MMDNRIAGAGAVRLRLVFVTVVASLVVACSPRHEPPESARESVTPASCEGRLALPRIDPSSKYQHWHLLVSKSGSKQWNGQNVDAATLRQYMVDLSRMRADAGNLIVHPEPGVSCRIIEEINRISKESPLCSQHRCFQDQWDYKRPIVN